MAAAGRAPGGTSGWAGIRWRSRSPQEVQGTVRNVVTSVEELRALVGEASALAERKQLGALDGHCRDFVARSPFVLLATSGADGSVDVSPRGDPAGFVRVLDERTLAVPERPGNRRVDSLRNVVERPGVGLLFLVPGYDETLRVNGRACVVRDDDLLATMEVRGKRPALAVVVEVDEAFLHCAKALRRSQLWHPEEWPDLSGLASAACIWKDHAGLADRTVEELDASLQEGYRTTLY